MKLATGNELDRFSFQGLKASPSLLYRGYLGQSMKPKVKKVETVPLLPHMLSLHTV
jgi:hypothetical protein